MIGARVVGGFLQAVLGKGGLMGAPRWEGGSYEWYSGGRWVGGLMSGPRGMVESL